MKTNNHYDVLIIGGGQAGVPLARALAKAGQRVALAERQDLGGSCVNFGCTPTKAALASARLAQQARRAADFGLKVPTVGVNFPAVLDRARQIALESRKSLDEGLEKSANPKLLRGHARFEGRDGESFQVRVGAEMVTAGQVVLNTGTRSLIPPIDGLRSVPFIHAGNWLDSRELPADLAIIGGGYIGLEMAQFYRRMGSSVTVLEESDQIAGHEDEDVATALQKLLEDEGIAFRRNTGVKNVAAQGGKVSLTLEKSGGSETIHASHLFVATGRKPNTDDLGLETIGVKVSERGIVEADVRLATSVKGVWAAGDIRGGPMFTHTAFDDYRVLMSQMTGDGTRTTERVVPYAVFTDPELGRVGSTEREARQAGKAVKVARFEMKKNGKAKEIGATAGFIKVIVEQKTDLILGAAVLAAEGAELVHMYVDMMNAEAPYTTIRDAVYIHPTLAEAVQSAVSAIA